MNADQIRTLVTRYKDDQIGIDELMEVLKSLPYEDLGFARIDHHRRIRSGYPEVIYGEGKSPEQAAAIFERLAAHNGSVLCTRATPEMAEAIRCAVPDARYHTVCRIVELRRGSRKPEGLVVVATGGTSDIPVAEEAAIVLESFNSRVERLFDVGVAGIHRLLAHTDLLRQANCIIAAAGMEGALPSVIGGLVEVPVIAVPTSIGYGASFGGVTALLAMLNSCAAGVSVVNIDNGFGAACQADMINKLAVSGRDMR